MLFKVLLNVFLVESLVESAELRVRAEIGGGDYSFMITYTGSIKCSNTSDLELTCNGTIDEFANIDVSVDSSRTDYALGIFTKCTECTTQLPLLVGVHRQEDVISWKLPAVIPIGTDRNSHTRRYKSQNVTYDETSRTLQPPDGSDSLRWGEQIGITLRNRNKRLFELKIWMYKFELKLDKMETVKLSPTKPNYFKFNLPQNVSRALLEVKSSDDSCMTLSIQDSRNPVHDLYSNVKFDGHYQTVNRTGLMWISKEQFDGSIHVVMVAHPDDSECHLNPFGLFHRFKTNTSGTKIYPEKNVTVMIKKSKTVDEFKSVMITTILVFVIFSLVAVFMACFQAGWDVLKMKNIVANNVQMRQKQYPANDSTGKKELGRNEVVRYSVLYIKGFWLVAIFYSIPVVQLMLTMERMTNENGNKDECFLNFQCAHAWIGSEKKQKISDFNHVFSNIGFLILGITSLVCIRIHQKRAQMHTGHSKHQHTMNESQNTADTKNVSSECTTDAIFILKDYGLYYALGSAMIMQGVMSMCYHICPNSVSFQFDTIFMFCIAILCITTMYNRLNPWQSVSVFTVYGVLSGIILLGIFGVFFDAEYMTSGQGKWMLLAFRWVSFGITTSGCIILSYLCYSEKRINLNLNAVKSLFGSIFRRKKRLLDIQSGELKSYCTPDHPKRLMLLVVWNIINIILSSLTIVRFESTTFLDGMLGQLTFNTLMLIVVYVIYKKMHTEKITNLTIILLSLAGVFWGIALYFFKTKVKNDEKSPADSRALNRPCKAWTGNFYDEHDLWHFFCSVGLFLNLMIVMTLDDRLMKGKETIQKEVRGVTAQHHRPVTAYGEKQEYSVVME